MKHLAREAGESISSDVKKIILASIPERENELVYIYDKYEPTFAEGGDKKGWFLEAGSNLIRFIYRTLLVAACEQKHVDLQTRACVGQRYVRIRAHLG